MAAALDEVDRMDIVCVDDPRAAQRAHYVRENVREDLLPGEVSLEGRHCNRDCGVNVARGDPAGDPRAAD